MDSLSKTFKHQKRH